MEAASVPAAPAAADAGAQPQAPAAPQAPAQGAPPASAQTPPQPFQRPGEQPTGEADVHAQLARMEKTIQELQGQGQQQQPADLLSALSPEQDLGLTPEEIANFQAGQLPGEGGEQQVPQDEQAAQEALDHYVNELIEERLNPLVQERQHEQVKAFQEKHPDIVQPEILSEVEATMQNFVVRYGEGARFDTGLLELAYTSVKAKLADAGAVPAEQAANHGASIETQAGQSQTGEPSEEDLYKSAVFGTGTSGGEGFR